MRGKDSLVYYMREKKRENGDWSMSEEEELLEVGCAEKFYYKIHLANMVKYRGL